MTQQNSLIPMPLNDNKDSHVGALRALLGLTINGLDSPHTRRAYKRDIEDFLEWWFDVAHFRQLNKAGVEAYRAFQRKHGRSESAINRNLSAVRRFISDAAENNLIDPRDAESAKRVKGFKLRGQRQGQWLTLEDLTRLVSAPSRDTARGRRDRMALALLGGAGLRRSEMVSLAAEQVQQREGRWVISDLQGKGNKTRTIPIATWLHTVLADWQDISGLRKGRLFQRVGCPSKKAHGLTTVGRLGACEESEEILLGPYPTENAGEQEIYRIVKRYADQLGIELAPHDLRRTYAKLSRKAGAPLEQIQITLGHASLNTTERYLGAELDLDNSPSDLIVVKPR